MNYTETFGNSKYAKTARASVYEVPSGVYGMRKGSSPDASREVAKDWDCPTRVLGWPLVEGGGVCAVIVSWALLLDALASTMARAAMPKFLEAKETIMQFVAVSCEIGLRV